jgi:beta-lactamase class D
MRIWLILLIFFGSFYQHLEGKENFILIHGNTNRIIKELGNGIDKRVTPCSTFKIALSLMGFDAGVLNNEKHPVWHFQEGYDDFLESWKMPQTPQLWMRYSCIWYSKVLALQLGLGTIQHYLASLEYGNQDLSGFQLGDKNPVWLNSSLKISPREQVEFIRKMIENELPISNHSIEMTKSILFIEDLPGGWKLFGKTGASGFTHEQIEMGWFVGWIEKNDEFFPFAYNICEKKVDYKQRIPRTKHLLKVSNVLN